MAKCPFRPRASRGRWGCKPLTASGSGKPGTPEYAKAALSEAIKVTGVGSDWLPYLLWIAKRESSYGADTYNSTSVGGEHATGLMQTLPSTFKAHAYKGHGNINNPVDNAIAAIDYIKGRYKHPSRIPNIFNWNAYKGY